jgi:hypothetical protein
MNEFSEGIVNDSKKSFAVKEINGQICWIAAMILVAMENLSIFPFFRRCTA